MGIILNVSLKLVFVISQEYRGKGKPFREDIMCLNIVIMGLAKKNDL
jgi:hypothetical protein